MDKKCPNCDALNPDVAKFCRICGYKIGVSPEISDFQVMSVDGKNNVVIFTWTVHNADKITLSGQDVSKTSKKIISLVKDKNFELVAIKGAEQISKQIFVHCLSHTLISADAIVKQKPFSGKRLLCYIKYPLLLCMVLALVLLSLKIGDVTIRSSLHLGYSTWQHCGNIAEITCCILLSICFLWLVRTIINFIKNEVNSENLSKY